MKKIGLISLALVMALGMLGAVYAMWSEELTIEGTVTTGTVDVEFSQYSNDAGPHGTAGAGGFFTGNFDPEVPGTWDPATQTWCGDRADKNVGSTDCALTPDTLTITVDNAYPCYFGSILYDIHNVGTIPVKVISWELISVSKNAQTMTLTTPLALTPCTWYYVNVDATPPTVRGSATPPPAGAEAGEDFAFHLSEYPEDPLYDLAQIDPGEVGYGDVTVHLEQDAEMDTIYDFTIKVTVCNWNEPDGS